MDIKTGIITPSWYGQKKAIRVVAWALPPLIYCAIAAVFFGPRLTPSTDPESFVWFLNWWPFALTHHLNPFITNYVYYPRGFNLAWATAIPAVALVMSPITLLFGANTAFNIVTLLAPALSAAACFYLVHFITKKYFPSLLAGYIYGFSSYELGQLLGHTNLYVTFLIPLAVLVFLLRVRQRIKKLPYIVLLSLITVLQFGTSIEIFTTFAFFAAVSVVIFYLSSQSVIRKRIATTLHESLWSLAASLIILSPYLYYLLLGYSSVPKVLNNPSDYSADLLNYIIPTQMTRIGRGVFSTISVNFSGGPVEAGAFLGVPLVFIIFHYATTYWRKPYTKSLVILLMCLIAASLGPTLHVNGLDVHIPLPWLVATHIPVLRLILPTRLSLYVALVAAVIAGLWLSNESSRGRLALKYAVVLVAIVCILPSPSQYNWGRTPVPKFFTKGTVSKFIKKDQNVVVLPYGVEGESMYYQYASGMRFTQSGGYVGFTPTQFSAAFTWSSATFKNNLKAFCAANKVTEIIYTPQTSTPLATDLTALGWPTRHIEGVAVVTVPQP